jgi:hypothetical protein
MMDQCRRRQGECVALAERMALQELQVSLFAPLPLRDLLEGFDVPADELGERGCALLDAGERGWGSMRERAALTVQDRPDA